MQRVARIDARERRPDGAARRASRRATARRRPATSRRAAASARSSPSDVRAGEQAHRLGERRGRARRPRVSTASKLVEHAARASRDRPRPSARGRARRPSAAGEQLRRSRRRSALAVERDLHAGSRAAPPCRARTAACRRRSRVTRGRGGRFARHAAGHAHDDAGRLEPRDVASAAETPRPASSAADERSRPRRPSPCSQAHCSAARCTGRSSDSSRDLVRRARVLAQRPAERQVLRLRVRRQPRRVRREEGERRLVVLAVLGEVEVDAADQVPRRALARRGTPAPSVFDSASSARNAASSSSQSASSTAGVRYSAPVIGGAAAASASSSIGRRRRDRRQRAAVVDVRHACRPPSRSARRGRASSRTPAAAASPPRPRRAAGDRAPRRARRRSRAAPRDQRQRGRVVRRREQQSAVRGEDWSERLHRGAEIRGCLVGQSRPVNNLNSITYETLHYSLHL